MLYLYCINLRGVSHSIAGDMKPIQQEGAVIKTSASFTSNNGRSLASDTADDDWEMVSKEPSRYVLYSNILLTAEVLVLIIMFGFFKSANQQIK